MKEEVVKIEDLNTINLEDILQTRQWFYDFLGKSFYLEPERDRLIDISNLNIFEQFIDDNGEIESEGASLLSRFFKTVGEMKEEEIKNLKQEYNTLFVGPGHLQAPPWESVYLSKERIIFDEHTLSVREFYKSWGVNIKTKNKEPDDHIGFQMEFMSILSRKGIDAIKENDINRLEKIMIGQNKFLESHTLLWIDRFSENVFNNSKTSFFKGLSLFLSEYVKMDKELLVDLIDKTKNIN